MFCEKALHPCLSYIAGAGHALRRSVFLKNFADLRLVYTGILCRMKDHLWRYAASKPAQKR
jgi:hypothetical protein